VAYFRINGDKPDPIRRTGAAHDYNIGAEGSPSQERQPSVEGVLP
jgi:hypothetical protein